MREETRSHVGQTSAVTSQKVRFWIYNHEFCVLKIMNFVFKMRNFAFESWPEEAQGLPLLAEVAVKAQAGRRTTCHNSNLNLYTIIITPCSRLPARRSGWVSCGVSPSVSPAVSSPVCSSAPYH